MKILMCSDGSRQAENAVRFCALLASACNAEVTLFGIVEDASLEQDLYNSLRRSQQLLKEKQIAVELTTRSGEPVAEITQHTKRTRYDLVVIGAVRKATEGAFWVSAKAYKLVKVLVAPVLVVIGHPQKLNRILLCSGGSQFVTKAVKTAGSLAGCIQAGVTLVHVFVQPPALYSGMIANLEDTEGLLNSSSLLGRNLRQQKELLEAMKVQTELKLRHGPVLQELLAEIHEGNYDLVTLGFAPGSQLVRSYLMGDITREIINRADRPVLVVQAAGSEFPEGIAGLVARFRNLFAGSIDDPATPGGQAQRSVHPASSQI